MGQAAPGGSTRPPSLHQQTGFERQKGTGWVLPCSTVLRSCDNGAGSYHPSSTILPRDLPLSSSAWARLRLAALMVPKVWSSVVRSTPLSMRSARSEEHTSELQ